MSMRFVVWLAYFAAVAVVLALVLYGCATPIGQMDDATGAALSRKIKK